MPPTSRLLKELTELKQYPDFNGGPTTDLLHWEIKILGPRATPYEGGIFLLQVIFPSDYPFKPPKIRFQNRIFHPNISEKGDICLDLLKNEWSPVLSISRVLISIQSLLDDPNAMSPLNGDAARMYREDVRVYEREVRKYVKLYART